MLRDAYELAGYVGCDWRSVSLRQLLRMARGKASHEWLQTATICWTVYSMLRSSKSARLSLRDFLPDALRDTIRQPTQQLQSVRDLAKHLPDLVRSFDDGRR